MILHREPEHHPKTHAMKLTLALIIALMSIGGCSFNNPPKVAPPFTIELYSTNDHSEQEEFNLEDQKGTPTFVNFWFPSCPPCVAEMPQLNNFYSQHKNDVDVVAIQLIGLDSKEDGQKFVKEKNIHFAVGPDEIGKISIDYQINVYPTTIFIDSAGKIADYWQGEINSRELKEKLAEIQESED